MGIDPYDAVSWENDAAGGTAATVQRGPRRWEAAHAYARNALADHDDRLGNVESYAQTPTTGTRSGQTADAGPPTLGGLPFINQQTNELWLPNGTGWLKVALTAVSGVSGGSNAPTNFVANTASDNTVPKSWTLPTPPAGYTITAVTVREKFKSPGGISGMPLPGTATSHTSAASSTASTREYYVTCTFTKTSDGTTIESAESNHYSLSLPYNSGNNGSPVTGSGGSSGGSTGGTSGTPASILNNGPGSGQVHFSVDIGERSGPNVSHTMTDLAAGFAQDPYYGANADSTAVSMTSFADSGTTKGSPHARTEHRERNADDSLASWNMGSGSHVMSGISRYTVAPGGSKPWTCFAQIHDANGDVVRLQWEGSSNTSLAIKARTHSPNGSTSTEVVTTLQASYTLGQDVSWKIEDINGTCKLYIGGTVQKTITLSGSGGYFKAGNYIQFNTGDGYAGSASATVELRSLAVTHS